MANIKRGRFSLSVNVILTSSLITRVFTFGGLMVAFYMKAGASILNDNVIKIVNNYEINGTSIRYGSALQSLVFSFGGVFGLDLISGICVTYGVFKGKKQMLVAHVMLSSLLLVVYCIYIVLFSIIYDKRTGLQEEFSVYNAAYMSGYMSNTYRYSAYPDFLRKLGCTTTYGSCYDIYSDQLKIYVSFYLGLIITCIICQVVSIVAVEYTYRKMEVKENNVRISVTQYFLLCTLKHGIFRNFLLFVKENWTRSKFVFVSVVLKLFSLIFGVGLLGLGFTIVSHEIITDSQLKSFLYRLQFYDYYLYDILIGVTATCIVIGIATTAVSITGLVGSWRHSWRIMLLTTLLSLTLQLARIASIIIWIVFIDKINDELRTQLVVQQTSYNIDYYDPTYGYYRNEVMNEWSTMIQKLDCCGVNITTDTSWSINAYILCYENAKEIFVHPSEYYTNYYNLDFTIGRGSERTMTCTSRLRFILRMMIGWCVAITLLQAVIEGIGIFFVNREFRLYHQDENQIMEEKILLSEENKQKPISIIKFVFVGVKSFATKLLKRSKIGFVMLIFVIIYLILNIGILVIGVHIRYHKIFGNKLINDNVFTSISTAGYSLSSIIEKFHIVVTTFALASLAIGTFAMVVKSLKLDTRIIPLFTVVGLFAASFIGHIVQFSIWTAYFGNMGNFTGEFQKDLQSFYFPSYSYYEHPKSIGWNALFIKGECCGAGTTVQDSILTTAWRNSLPSESLPIYCCKSHTRLYPYTYRYLFDTDCTNQQLDGTYYTKMCDSAVLENLNTISFSWSGLVIVTAIVEVICIILTSCELFKQNKRRKLSIAADFAPVNDNQKDDVATTSMNRNEQRKQKEKITSKSTLKRQKSSQKMNRSEK